MGVGDEVNVVGLAVVKAKVLDDLALPPLSPLSDLVDPFVTDLAPPPLIPPLSDLVDPLIVGPVVPDLLVGLAVVGLRLAVVGLGVVGHIVVGGSVGSRSWGQSSGFSPKRVHKSSMICSGS